MTKRRESGARQELAKAATELFRRNGYVATRVEEICEMAGVTKGAFFHHFSSKEALAKVCLEQWDNMASAMEAGATFQSEGDPVAKIIGYMDHFIGIFSNPNIFKSCLAGTTLQEISESHPDLRRAANDCLIHAEDRFKRLLEDACKKRGVKLDSAGLASLWIAAIQGSLLLFKGSRNEALVSRNLAQLKLFISGLFEDEGKRSRKEKRARK